MRTVPAIWLVMIISKGRAQIISNDRVINRVITLIAFNEIEGGTDTSYKANKTPHSIQNSPPLFHNIFNATPSLRPLPTASSAGHIPRCEPRPHPARKAGLTSPDGFREPVRFFNPSRLSRSTVSSIIKSPAMV